MIYICAKPPLAQHSEGPCFNPIASQQFKRDRNVWGMDFSQWWRLILRSYGFWYLVVWQVGSVLWRTILPPC